VRMDGDKLLKPMAIYEVVSPALAKKYVAEKATVRSNRCDPREPSVRCDTDGVFTGALSDELGGSDLEPTAPLNEKLLLHATGPRTVDKILHKGMNDTFSSKGQAFGSGIYFADLVCKSAAYAETPMPSAAINKLLRLTTAESARAKYLLVFRVMLGCAARTTQRFDNLYNRNGYVSSGAQKLPIYAPGSMGGAFAAPFTSLVAEPPNSPREYVIKNSERERALLIGIVAYDDTSMSVQQGQNRVFNFNSA